MLLNFPFPHRYPYGETIFTVMNIPIRFSNGFHTVGIITLILMFIGLFFLVKSLRKFRGRMVLLAFFVVTFVPSVIANTFQSTFATGIYAVSYSSEESNCNFEMIGETTLHGECELTFTNYSKDDVRFTVEFQEYSLFKDDIPMVSLMNDHGPHKVFLEGKENKVVPIEATIDVKEMEGYVVSGEAMHVDIAITSKKKSRDL